MEKLGRIERVDLRSIWTKEDKHFTTWLAKPENLKILGKTLGVVLELEAQEKDVGPFRADILCKNAAGENCRVVIENQIEKTDHKHLGQLLTYASNLEAATIVWISAEFTEQHRAALDWLNQLAGTSARFFGLEIELLTIDGSVPAPRFNVVCKPQDSGPTVHRTAKDSTTGGGGTPLHNLRLKYWAAFRSYLQEHSNKLQTKEPSGNLWYSFKIGATGAHFSSRVFYSERRIEVGLVITCKDAKSIFNELLSEKHAIEAIIGSPLDWRDKKSPGINLSSPADPYDEATWPQQFAWLQSNLEKFDQAFRPWLASKD
jgi:hypothetical protein